MAEQVEFELSVLFGESGANTNRLTWPIRNSNSRYGSRKFCRWLGRIESESEPPNLATEKYAACGVLLASNSQSPVRIHEGSTAKTRRNRGVFWDCSRLCARSLCDGRPNGGASRIRTPSTVGDHVEVKKSGHLADQDHAQRCVITSSFRSSRRGIPCSPAEISLFSNLGK